MNNSQHTERASLNFAYAQCIQKQLADFTAKKGPVELENREWCKTEKDAYFNYLREHFKVEYENLLRLETQNY